MLAARLGVPARLIRTRVVKTGDLMPQCDFRVTGIAQPLSVSVSVDSSPQPYQVLERQIDEQSQMFTPVRATPAPQKVGHLGLDAAWFPEQQYVLTTDGKVLITVTVVNWPVHSQGARKALATAVARPYLGRLVGAKTDKGEV